MGDASQQWASSQPATTDQIQYMAQLPWVAFQVEGVLGASDAPGEIFYVLNELNATDKLGGNITVRFNSYPIYCQALTAGLATFTHSLSPHIPGDVSTEQLHDCV